ncbi:MAG: type I-C CRISPR-associated endonuclease Cas1 [Verrucomicrobiales bacterium]|nr:type I-C CRISPR-associated endonuclease Cas1 [Verrucomicrobiales bacterium]
MRKHLNTLFITLDGAWLGKDGEAVIVRHEHETKLRVPLHNLDGIVALGWDISCSAPLMAACAEKDVTLSFCTPYGKFQAAVRGFSSGNILLRREQYRRADDEAASLAIARPMIAAKIINQRTVLLRAVRDHGGDERSAALKATCAELAYNAQATAKVTTLDSLRGLEGDAAKRYFDAFPHLITHPAFTFPGRTKRPPTDPTNALLSFLYAMLAHDCRSACETVGLDPQCGFLHRDRPGRPSLALDLMEELRPVLADRLALSLINRQQVKPSDFLTKETGAVEMKEATRKTVLIAYQERKQQELEHPFLGEKITLGLVCHLQARLLARHLRGDLDAYPAFLWK